MSDAPVTLEAWQAAEKRFTAGQVTDARCIAERLPLEFLESLSPAEALAVRYSPELMLRPRQIAPPGDWLVLAFVCARGWGKTHAAAGKFAHEVLTNRPEHPAEFGLIAPRLEDAWNLQIEALRYWIPPWCRMLEQRARDTIVFPDHGVTVRIYSAQSPQLRGPNMQLLWGTELVKWVRGEELMRNARLAVRVPRLDGRPPQIILDTTPPAELNWVAALCAERTTRVVRGSMLDNPAIDARVVEAAIESMGNTPSARREIRGEFAFGGDKSLVSLEAVERNRVHTRPVMNSVVLGIDPAGSGSKDSDPTGLVVAGISGGHVYILESVSAQMEPEAWSAEAVRLIIEHRVSRAAIEHATGSGGASARALLATQLRLAGASCALLDSKARGNKRDRAAPLAVLINSDRCHLVGNGHAELVRDLTLWQPGDRPSPGALDAAVHAVASLTNGWQTGI